jgi:D-sedoheptulose 7-phosphate isomerase
MPVIGLTGESRSRLSALADVCIRVPGRQTHEIQELHLPVYHTLCLMLEEHFFGE